MEVRAGREAASRLLVPRVLVPILFAALLVGGVAALLITRELRRGDDVVNAVKVTHRFSPSEQDAEPARIRFRLTEPDRQVAVEVIDSEMTTVRVLAVGRALGPGRHEFEWDGRTGTGAAAPEGRYQIRIVLGEQGREVVPADAIRVQAPGRA